MYQKRKIYTLQNVINIAIVFRLFKPVRHDANIALEASNAYLNIVDSLQLARNAANNASVLADASFKTVSFKQLYKKNTCYILSRMVLKEQNLNI